MNNSTTQVIVVGAGPTGLLLAGDLAAAGVTTTVLERRTEESNLSRAFAVHARTLEQLDARGLADELVATGQQVGEIRLFENGEVDLSRLPSRFPYVLVTPQYHTERLLEERARAHGARIHYGLEVTDLRQDPDGVEVSARTRDGATSSFRAPYVVGTDGVRSTVRRALGVPFPGKSVVRSVMLADVRLAQAPADVLTVNAVKEGLAFIAPFGDGWYRVIAWNRRRQVADNEPVELDEVRQITRAALGTDYGMHDPRWLSRFHNDERQVPHYRVGRVFLAGDAAHVHSPAGGQGMNTGLQDAANVSWKLAAAVRGWGDDQLLDSYHAERHPVGRMVLRMSGGLLRLALLEPRPLRLARGLLGGAALSVGPVTNAAAREVSGIGISYPSPRGSHRLAGQRAPDVRLADGAPDGRLYEALRRQRFVLLDASASDGAAPDGSASGGVTSTREPSPVQEWPAAVEVAVPAVTGPPLVLVRPDGYIAWASEETDPVRRDSALREALARWCGPPAGRTTT